MNSVERVKHLCKEKKIPISKLEKDLGFSNGYIGQLRKGVFPSDRLSMIAEYLDVTIEYLMTGSEAKDSNPEITRRDERDIAKDLDNIMAKIRSGEDGPLRYNGEVIDDESLALLESAIGTSLRHLKIINKKKYGRKNKE